MFSFALSPLMIGPLGMQEMLIILVVALIVFGPRKLPQIGKTLGKSVAEFRRTSNELRSTLEREVQMEEFRDARSAVSGLEGEIREGLDPASGQSEKSSSGQTEKPASGQAEKPAGKPAGPDAGKASAGAAPSGKNDAPPVKGKEASGSAPTSSSAASSGPKPGESS